MRVVDNLLDVRRHRTEIAPLRGGVDINDAPNVVVGDDAVEGLGRKGREPAEPVVFEFPFLSGTYLRSPSVSMPYCGVWTETE